MEISIRLLTPDDFSQMYRTFIDAFSSYSVKMELSKDAFRERMENKVRIDYSSSVGAFDGEKLIGFIFHNISTYEGHKTAYNGGTGVLRHYWGQGIVSRMYHFLFPLLKKKEVARCLLEVITSNEKALKAYKKLDFEPTKHFKCFKLSGQFPFRKPPEGLLIKTSHPKNLSHLACLGETTPALIDSHDHLTRNLINETCLEAFMNDTLVGYIIFQHKSGRISQLAVEAAYRRKGIGLSLIRKAREITRQQPLTLLNVEKEQNALVAFLEKSGFVNEVDQYEMVRWLTA